MPEMEEISFSYIFGGNGKVLPIIGAGVGCLLLFPFPHFCLKEDIESPYSSPSLKSMIKINSGIVFFPFSL